MWSGAVACTDLHWGRGEIASWGLGVSLGVSLGVHFGGHRNTKTWNGTLILVIKGAGAQAPQVYTPQPQDLDKSSAQTLWPASTPSHQMLASCTIPIFKLTELNEIFWIISINNLTCDELNHTGQRRTAQPSYWKRKSLIALDWINFVALIRFSVYFVHLVKTMQFYFYIWPVLIFLNAAVKYRCQFISIYIFPILYLSYCFFYTDVIIALCNK